MEKNELSLFNKEMSKQYCSKNLETIEEKKEMYNALESCEVLLNDIKGEEIEVRDVYCEEKTVVDETTGIVKTKYRTILFDKDGKTYATGSYGVFNSLRKIFAIYGTPETWEEPVKVKVSTRPLKDGKSSLVLTLV